MLEYDRFSVEKKEHIFSYAPDFANCKEETIQQAGAIMVDFMREPQKAAESPCELAETVYTDNANPPVSQRETGEIAQEDTTAIVAPNNTGNNEIYHESGHKKGHISNFANARLY